MCQWPIQIVNSGAPYISFTSLTYSKLGTTKNSSFLQWLVMTYHALRHHCKVSTFWPVTSATPPVMIPIEGSTPVS
ncbi:hypothetical protein SCLCIDRAFT_1212258 [Scleroderma citrinum Foug A]|uniref:Uncharacterized protein n=1 Tax=Scleroderma citrinum Foug A TaxID=1036808 RepID=A0A0C3EB04_9AGAM|nr:hypothetical protein SCLCIDRAFT_1212258 [Scleroderma citrinum Foug A]